MYDALIYGGVLLFVISAISDLLGFGSGPIGGEHVYGPIQVVGNVLGISIAVLGFVMKKSLR